MRRVITPFIMLSLLLTGCSALPYAHQIDKTVLMEVLGVDAGAGETVTVTAASGARPGDQEPLVLSTQAGTISAASPTWGSGGRTLSFSVTWSRYW